MADPPKPRPARKRAAPAPVAAPATPPAAVLHKPRSLPAEIGVIVVGVLIALAAQQTAEWLNWRGQAAEARANLVGDERRLIGWVGEREALSPCIASTLAAASALVDAGAAARRLPAHAPLSPPPRAGWTLRTWDTLTSGQTLSHLPTKLAQGTTTVSVFLENMPRQRDRESEDWAVLNTLAGPGRPFSEAEETRAREAIASARLQAQMLRWSGQQMATVIRDAGLIAPAQLEADWKEGHARGAASPYCRGEYRPVGSALDAPPSPPWTRPAFVR